MSALLPILFGFSVSMPCEMTPVDPSEYPTAVEIMTAQKFVGVDTAPTIAVVPRDCMTEDGHTAEGLYYPGYSLMILADGWRERNDGIVILVHEMFHYKEDLTNEYRQISECRAYDAGARFAAKTGAWDRWSAEALFGLMHCVGGQDYRFNYFDIRDGKLTMWSEPDPDESVLVPLTEALRKTWPELETPHPFPEWRS